MDNKWVEILNLEFNKDYFKELNDYLDNRYKVSKIYPPKDLIFNAFNLTNYDDVKVIILGQDPYHEEGQAMGLAFSVPLGTKLPPSLKNIFKEIEDEFNILKLNNGDLTYLAKQGVLLLNTILTVEEGKPLSHKNKGWEIFTDNIIKYLNEDNKPKVFMLWGDNAISKTKLITNPNHLVLTSAHPSPLSAYRGFFNNNHFRLCNEFLKKNNLKEINW